MKPSTFTARVADLVARAEMPPVRCWEDPPDRRIKIQLRAMPDEDTRKLLRSNGFRFVGGQSQSQYWVRALNQAGRTAAASVMAVLERMNEK